MLLHPPNNHTQTKPIKKTPEITQTTPIQIQSQFAEKVKAVQIFTPELPVEAQRQSVFERITEKDVSPKAWAEHNLKRLIETIFTRKAETHMPRDLVKKSLEEHNGSPFTQKNKSCPSEEIFHAKIHNI